MTDKLATMHTVCSTVDDELWAIRHTCDELIKQNKAFAPMLTFYSDKETRTLVVVIPAQDEFNKTLMRISEALYMYSALKSHCVFITLPADITDDEGNFQSHSLNTFLLSEDYAFTSNMPFNFENDAVVWHEDRFESTNILDKTYQGLTREMMNIFYMYSHIEESPYSISEIASYLSFTGAEILFNKNIDISYFDMSST